MPKSKQKHGRKFTKKQVQHRMDCPVKAEKRNRGYELISAVLTRFKV